MNLTYKYERLIALDNLMDIFFSVLVRANLGTFDSVSLSQGYDIGRLVEDSR
jgi:hypothetical protein